MSLLLLPVCGKAQNDKESYEAYKKRMQEEYSNYKRQKKDEYEAFRRKANEDYAAFLKQRWEDMQAFKGIPAPKEPKPPRPVIAPVSKIPTSDPIPAVPMPLPAVPPPVVLPDIPDVDVPQKKTLRTSLFYGVNLSFDYNAEVEQLKVDNVERGGLGEAWLFLSKRETDALVHDCIETSRRLNLPDWGFLTLVRTVAVELVGKKTGGGGGTLASRLAARENDEALMLEAYILSQAGYMTRFAKYSESGELKLTVCFGETICENTYFEIEGRKYYVISGEDGRYKIVGGDFDGAKPMSIAMTSLPKLPGGGASTQRQYNTKRYPQPHYSGMNLSRSLLDFFSDYPRSEVSHWTLYSFASLSDGVKNAIYPDLRRAIDGKGKAEAADILIDFVQQAFQYATDRDQFGYERPLFGDETFYYPYSDCEDRAILYSILVRELLGLDVLLLHFPGHMGTAVRFPGNVEGDYLVFEGQKYIICDPTYIGARIGMCMPQYKKEGVEIEALPVFTHR